MDRAHVIHLLNVAIRNLSEYEFASEFLTLADQPKLIENAWAELNILATMLGLTEEYANLGGK